MLNEVTVRGGFSTLNVKSGKCVLQFELDQRQRDLIPKLASMTGRILHIHLYGDQEILFADSETGEIQDEAYMPPEAS